MSYMDQPIRAVRETIVEMVRLQEFPEYPSVILFIRFKKL